MYHYGAELPGAELTRIRSKAALFEEYGAIAAPSPSELAQEILAMADVPYRKEAGAGYASLVDRYQGLHPALPAPLELTAEEVARWSQGVPPQKCARGDIEVYDCVTDPNLDLYGEYSKAQIWEQFAYASKLFRGGQVRSIALEFDHMDLEGDGSRPESVLRTYAQQVARPLARLISDLKAAKLYDRTVIAIYTLDGSRRPAANSYGNDGKGTILLAGGRIKGGYYGDIEIAGSMPGGHIYAFRRPDPKTGELQEAITNWGDPSKRTPAASVWRTVIKALGIPETEYVGRFNSLIDDAATLDCMLKS